MIEARRELAKAMGWTQGLGEYRIHSLGSSNKRKLLTPGWTNPEGRFYADYDRQEDRILPNPFSSAIHDYAILEWLRPENFRESTPSMGPEHERWRDFIFELRLVQLKEKRESSAIQEGYMLGDNAKALCVLLDIELEAT